MEQPKLLQFRRFTICNTNHLPLSQQFSTLHNDFLQSGAYHDHQYQKEVHDSLKLIALQGGSAAEIGSMDGNPSQVEKELSSQRLSSKAHLLRRKFKPFKSQDIKKALLGAQPTNIGGQAS
jgi:hypothetical protein